jgi:hypothetical protein
LRSVSASKNSGLHGTKRIELPPAYVLCYANSERDKMTHKQYARSFGRQFTLGRRLVSTICQLDFDNT